MATPAQYFVVLIHQTQATNVPNYVESIYPVVTHAARPVPVAVKMMQKETPLRVILNALLHAVETTKTADTLAESLAMVMSLVRPVKNSAVLAAPIATVQRLAVSLVLPVPRNAHTAAGIKATARCHVPFLATLSLALGAATSF